MIPEDLSKVKNKNCEEVSSYEYLNRLLKRGKQIPLPNTIQEGETAYELVERIKQIPEINILLFDLLNNQEDIDIFSSSVYPEKYKEYWDIEDNNNGTSSDQKELQYVDNKRFLLLLYQEFKTKVARGPEAVDYKDKYLTGNKLMDDITEETLKRIYTSGTKSNKSVEKILKTEIEDAFKNIDKSKVIVFSTGYEEPNSEFHSFTYNEIVNDKSSKNKYLADFSPEEKNFIAKQILPLDIEEMSEYGECGYKAMCNMSSRSKTYVPKATQEEINRFKWIPENEKVETYTIGPDSVIREEMRKYLDNPEYTSYLDMRKFDMTVLYRTLNFLHDRAMLTDYEPVKIVNFVMKMADRTYADTKDLPKDEPIELFKDIGSKKHISKIVEVNYQNLIKYCASEIQEYVDEKIYNNPENFEKILRGTDYIFSVKELEYIARIIPEQPEQLIYECYEKGYLKENELIDLIDENEDLSETKLFAAILKENNPNTKIENLQKIYGKSDNQSEIISEYLEKAYLTGALSISEINKNRKEIISKLPNIDMSKIDVNIDKLVDEFIIANREDIYLDLKDKEGFDDQDFKDFFEDIPVFDKEFSDEEIEKIMEDYQYNRAIFLSNGMQEDESAVFKIEKKLENIICSPSILKLLYAEGLITKQKGIELGAKDFLDAIEDREQIKAEEQKDINKNNNGKNENGQIVVKTPNEKMVELEELFKRTTKNSKKISRYDANKFIEDYNKIRESLPNEIKSDFDKMFNEFQQEFISNNNKLYEDSLVKLGKAQILSKETLLALAEKEDYMNVIGILVSDENALGVDTLKYIFNDKFEKNQIYEERHHKRNLLEKLFKTRYFTQDDKFSILTSIYGFHTEDVSEIQKGFDNDNFQFFIDNNYLMLDDVDEKTKSKITKASNSKKSKDTVITSRNEQLRYPFLDRINTYFEMDKDIVPIRTVNAWIYLSHKLDKAAVETIGTKKDGVIKNDITNHATYIMDSKTFEDMKETFIKTENDRKVLNFREVIEYFRMNSEDPKLSRICHTKHWKERVQKALNVNNGKVGGKDERN